jgi:hypothetical protein
VGGKERVSDGLLLTPMNSHCKEGGEGGERGRFKDESTLHNQRSNVFISHG